MYVVSGCPRSGTSLGMDLMRVAYGDDRLLGKKFPQESRKEEIEKRRPNETDEQYTTRMYCLNRTRNDEAIEARLEQTKDMNPNGFWEMLYTVQGCHYRYADLERLDKLLTEEKKSFCKIVSQGLAQSDPKYIDKVIFMIRHPRAVAKSQERLVRPGPLGDIARTKVDGEKLKVHSPEMFINVTGMVSYWFKRNPDIPVLYVFYDELLQNPDKVLSEIQEFIGEKGDMVSAAKQINKKLKRSEPEDVPSPLWEDAEFVYDNFLKRDYQKIVDYLSRPDIAFNRYTLQYPCLRSGRPVRPDICDVCRNKKSSYIKDKKKIAKKKKIDWENEPCIYECGYRLGFKPLSIKESIENNFWKDGVEPINIPEEKEILVSDRGEKMPKKDVILNRDYIDLIFENEEIFKYEFPNIPDDDWEAYKKKKRCGQCRKKVIGVMKEEPEKFNSIFSKLLDEDVQVHFPGPIEEPIVKEFENIVEMQKYLKELKSIGKQIKSANPSPNGKGGYLLVVM